MNGRERKGREGIAPEQQKKEISDDVWRDDGWADWRGEGESVELQINEGEDDPGGRCDGGEGSGDPRAGSDPRSSLRGEESRPAPGPERSRFPSTGMSTHVASLRYFSVIKNALAAEASLRQPPKHTRLQSAPFGLVNASAACVRRSTKQDKQAAQ